MLSLSIYALSDVVASNLVCKSALDRRGGFCVFISFIFSVVGGCCCCLIFRRSRLFAAAADDTECRPLEVTVISASDLEKARDYLKMHPYVVASLSGDEGHNNGQRGTPAHREGGTSPRWNHALDPFTVNVAVASAGLLTLKLEIKTEQTIKNHKDVGWVGVPVKELLKLGGDGESRLMRYAVRLLKSLGTRGDLEFSYQFGESFIMGVGATSQPLPNEQRPGAGVGLPNGLRIVDTMVDAADVDSDAMGSGRK